MAGRLRVSWLDVFTERPFGGNPLAVVPDADALATEQMQTLARELALSETTFTLEGDAALRIFTPAQELPLAGHPVVGTALELARLGRIASDGAHTFRTGAGDVTVELGEGAATMRQLEPRRGPDLDAAAIAPLLGGAELAGPPAICTTTGIRQAFAQVADRDALAAVAPDLAGIAALGGVDGLGVWCEHRDELAQRFFAPQMGVDEDPATGSAAGALGALRVFAGAAPGAVTVRQGDELGRPSTIEVLVGGEPGAPADVRIRGRAALVLEAEVAAETLTCG